MASKLGKTTTWAASFQQGEGERAPRSGFSAPQTLALPHAGPQERPGAAGAPPGCPKVGESCAKVAEERGGGGRERRREASARSPRHSRHLELSSQL